MWKNIFTAIAAISLGTAPVLASTWDDIETMSNLIKGTGTTIKIKECNDGRAGSYLYVENRIDELVICKDAVDMKDSNDVWEVLVHESVHVMQACNSGESIVKLKYHPRILREVKSHAPHLYSTLESYSDEAKLRETEAFWMELQTPKVAIHWMKSFCYKDDENS